MRALRLELARIRRCSSLARTADRGTRPSRWPRAGCTVAAVCLLVSALAACGGSSPGPAPTPTPSGPTPGPVAQTWMLSGTVSETAPTESTRIAGATVLAVAGLDAAGPTATTDSNGVFRFARLAPGHYTIRASAANYVERSEPLSVEENLTLTVQLDPVFQTVTTSKRDMVFGHPSCEGYWDAPTCEIPRTPGGEPCAVPYVLNVHHDGTLQVDLAWTDRRFGLGAELCGSNGGQPAGQAATALLDSSGHVAGYHVSAHTQYVVLVRSFSDGGGPPPAGSTEFALTVTGPN